MRSVLYMPFWVGFLKEKVLRFLNQSHIKSLYHRIENDDKNHGRLFVHFKFK